MRETVLRVDIAYCCAVTTGTAASVAGVATLKGGWSISVTKNRRSSGTGRGPLCCRAGEGGGGGGRSEIVLYDDNQDTYSPPEAFSP